MQREEKRFEFIPFIINMVIPMIYGAIASYIALRASKDWISTTNFGNSIPDDAILGPLRTGLRVSIGIAGFMIWRRRKTIANYKKLIIVYFASPTLSIIWSYMFFRAHLVLPSLFVISVAIVIGIYNMILFYRIKKLAALYIFPYVFWLVYLGILGLQVYLQQSQT